jgi:hypothetical protein
LNKWHDVRFWPKADMAPAKASYYCSATCYPTTLNGVVFAQGGSTCADEIS